MGCTALILAGAVAKGAFEAGVLSVLANETDLDIRRVVGASSGALNGAVFAAGLHTGSAPDAAAQLVDLWRGEASWRDVFKPDVMDILQLRGVGTHGHVLELMQRARAALPASGSGDVELRVVLTNLRGEMGAIDGRAATTFSSVRTFHGVDFDEEARWLTVCRTALGSAALPIVYAPVEVPDVGPCLDGGLLNNTPIKQALNGADTSRIIVVCANTALATVETGAKGLSLASEFIDILINERLYRDLRDAYDINAVLGELDRLRAEGTLSAPGLAAVQRALGWRSVEIFEVRPTEPLEGTAIAGFSDRKLRERYIAVGASSARRMLDALRW